MNHTKETRGGVNGSMSRARKIKHSITEIAPVMADKIEDTAEGFFRKLNQRPDVNDLLEKLADSPDAPTPEKVSDTTDSGIK